jgi:hypothetical protein
MTNPPAYQRVADRRRQERLDLIEEQKRAGTLKIRKMTKADWAEWGPVKDPAAAKKRAKRRELAEAKRRG